MGWIRNGWGDTPNNPLFETGGWILVIGRRICFRKSQDPKARHLNGTQTARDPNNRRASSLCGHFGQREVPPDVIPCLRIHCGYWGKHLCNGCPVGRIRRVILTTGLSISVAAWTHVLCRAPSPKRNWDAETSTGTGFRRQMRFRVGAMALELPNFMLFTGILNTLSQRTSRPTLEFVWWGVLERHGAHHVD